MIYRELWGLILSYSQLEGHKTLGTRLISGLDPYLLNWGYKLSRFHRNVCIFGRPDSPGNLPLPAQDCTALCYCFRLKSGRGSKAAKRLGDFLQTEWGCRLFQSRGARVHHPLFLWPPESFPVGLFCDHACLRLFLPWGILLVIG